MPEIKFERHLQRNIVQECNSGHIKLHLKPFVLFFEYNEKNFESNSNIFYIFTKRYIHFFVN